VVAKGAESILATSLFTYLTTRSAPAESRESIAPTYGLTASSRDFRRYAESVRELKNTQRFLSASLVDGTQTFSGTDRSVNDEQQEIVRIVPTRVDKVVGIENYPRSGHPVALILVLAASLLVIA
jgi:hypothetical protein